MSMLSPEMVQEGLQSLPGWKLEGKEIVRHYQFPDFVAAMAFVNQVAEKAESAGHHPDIDIRYNKVKLALVSHDQGGLTQRDMKMARHSTRYRRSIPNSLRGERLLIGPWAGLAGASSPRFYDSRWRRRYRQKLRKWRSTGLSARNSAVRVPRRPPSEASALEVETTSKRNLRSGMDDLRKKECRKRVGWRNLFLRTASMWWKGEVEPERYSNRDSKI